MKRAKPDEFSIFVTSTEEKFVSFFMDTGECKKVSKGVIIGSNGLIPTLSKGPIRY